MSFIIHRCRNPSFLIFIAFFLLSFTSCDSNKNSEKAPVSRPVKLKPTFVVVIDQLGAVQFKRYRATHSILNQLAKRSVLFPTARYEYLNAMTCPGHATIATGRLPRSHGIVANGWIEEGKDNERYCVDDSQYGISPQSLQAPTFGDIIKKLSPDTSVFSISGKDRSAVLLGGKNADLATWYDKKNGNFTSSKYYPVLPDSILDLNDRELWKEFLMTPWSSEVGKFKRAYSAEPFATYGFFGSIYNGPALDLLTFAAFKEVVKTSRDENNGENVYLLSLSALDIVGHQFGPDSPEYVDTLLAVDRILSELLQVVDTYYGSSGYNLVLTGDHGVYPLPEDDHTKSRISADEVSCIRKHLSKVVGRYGRLNTEVDYNMLTKVKENLQECSTVEDLVCPEKDFSTARWASFSKNTYFIGRGPSCYVILKDSILPYVGIGTTHVTPHPDDTDVPIFLFSTGMQGGYEVAEIVSPADIVPTLLELNQIQSETLFDGKSLLSKIQRR